MNEAAKAPREFRGKAINYALSVKTCSLKPFYFRQTILFKGTRGIESQLYDVLQLMIQLEEMFSAETSNPVRFEIYFF